MFSIISRFSDKFQDSIYLKLIVIKKILHLRLETILNLLTAKHQILNKITIQRLKNIRISKLTNLLIWLWVRNTSHRKTFQIIFQNLFCKKMTRILKVSNWSVHMSLNRRSTSLKWTKFTQKITDKKRKRNLNYSKRKIAFSNKKLRICLFG